MWGDKPKNDLDAIGAVVVYFLLMGYGGLLMIRLFRFGRSRLVLEGEPAPGGCLKGRLSARLDAAADEPLFLTLELVRKEYHRSWGEEEGHVRDVIIWDSDQEVSPGQWSRAENGRVEAPFCFDVPARVQGRDGWIRWRLTARRELPGADFVAMFRIPMAKPEFVSGHVGDDIGWLE